MYTLWTLFLSYSMKDSITSLKKCQKLLPILNFDVILSLAPPPSHSYRNITPSNKISMSFMNPVVNNYTWYSKPLYFRFTVFTCVSTVISLCLFAVQCSGAAVPQPCRPYCTPLQCAMRQRPCCLNCLLCIGKLVFFQEWDLWGCW